MTFDRDRALETVEAAVRARDSGRPTKRLYEAALLANISMVTYFAKRRSANCLMLEMDDLMQAGSLGLLRALETYDPNKGAFTTYATPWIKQHIGREVLNVERTVRLPQSAIRDIRTMLTSIEALQKDTYLSNERVARHCKLSADRVRELRSVSMFRAASLDEVVEFGPHATGLPPTRKDLLADPEDFVASAEKRQLADKVEGVLGCLTHKERIVIRARFWEDMTLEEVGRDVLGGLSKERARQIEANAIRKLRRAVKSLPGGEGALT